VGVLDRIKAVFRPGPAAAASAALSPIVLDDYFTEPLIDMGGIDPALAGILTPVSEVGRANAGITDQFLADGADYHRKYSNAPLFRIYFLKAFRMVGRPDGPVKILDIGTGPGVNTIQPCLDLFPDCQIVATDLSPPLLAILRSFVVSFGLENRVTTVCVNAMRDVFRPGAFDVVVGSAILHHLIDPLECLRAARRALKPGGIAIFFEPFEGYVMLRVAFETILERAEREGLDLPPAVAEVMTALCFDFQVRLGRDKSAERFAVIDDKWLFTRRYFDDMAKEAGFSAVSILSVHDLDALLFRHMTISLLGMARGITERDIPDWAWTHIDLLDRCISDDLKQDLVFEGVVVFTA
jgi:SAM-dependent methyltransferase